MLILIQYDYFYDNEQVLNIRKEYSPTIYNSTNCRTHIGYVENNLYKKSDNITFNSTHSTYKNINQNTADVINTYKISKRLELEKTCYNINDNVVAHKNNTIHINDNKVDAIIFLYLSCETDTNIFTFSSFWMKGRRSQASSTLIRWCAFPVLR